jgi:hypothetical protein
MGSMESVRWVARGVFAVFVAAGCGFGTELDAYVEGSDAGQRDGAGADASAGSGGGVEASAGSGGGAGLGEAGWEAPVCTDVMPEGTKEPCGNCADDNCDGLGDDEDPMCSASRHGCARAAPVGWVGPVSLFEGAPGALPACGSGFASKPAYDGYASPKVPAGCPCTCAPSGVHCTAHMATYHTTDPQKPCGNASPNPCPVPPNTCGPPPACSLDWQEGDVGSCREYCVIPWAVVTTKVVAGKCMVSSPLPTTPPAWSWGLAARACAPESPMREACADGQLCVPLPSAASKAVSCIFHGGDVSCPPTSGYPTKRVYFGAATDTRSCTGCACAAPVNGGCAGKMSKLSGADCAGASVYESFDIPIGCSDHFIALLRLDSLAFKPSGCAPSAGAGQLSGSVSPDPSTATTFCCLP